MTRSPSAPDDAATPGLVRRRVQRIPPRSGEGGGPEVTEDWLADEVPVAMVFNGISHAVMMASPLDLEDFALGFALSEGIVASADELRDVEARSEEHTSELQSH